MADDRDGGQGRRDGWRERDSSIFSDDDRWSRGEGGWSSEHGRSGGDDDRGFFERAGDEVRSWFGDEDAERRRERDIRRDEARSAFGGRDEDHGRGSSWSGGASGIRGGYGFSSQSAPRSDWERGGRERAGWGSGGFTGGTGGEPAFGGSRSHWDDNYRRWRDQQIQQLDREYDEYCRERQQQFEQDFDSWRTSRLTEGGATGSTATPTGSGGTRGTRSPPATPRGQGTESPGTTMGGGGSGSATGSSTGSTGAAMETGTTGTTGTEATGNRRSGRTRT